MTIFTSPEKTQQIAKELRQQGYSYSEIRDRLSAPKSTLAKWLKNLKLTSFQQERVDKKRRDGARKGSESKSRATQLAIKRIQESSFHDIGHISKRELWLMGIILYGKQSVGKDLHTGVHFTSSEEFSIRLFIRWLSEVGKLQTDDILPDIFLTNEQMDNKSNVVMHWSNITKIPIPQFTRFYIKKSTLHSRKRLSTPFGLLRLRIRASSMLARQISGWLLSIRSYLTTSVRCI